MNTEKSKEVGPYNRSETESSGTVEISYSGNTSYRKSDPGKLQRSTGLSPVRHNRPYGVCTMTREEQRSQSSVYPHWTG